MTRLGSALGVAIEGVVRWTIVPVADAIPFLVRTGLLLLLFAILWAAFLVALVMQPTTLDGAWRWLGAQALPVQTLTWLLFLPLTAGLWAWTSDWPEIVRVIVVLGLAGWNVVMLLPRREGPPASRGSSDAATPAAA